MNGFNKFLQTVGLGAAVYQLGMVGTKSNVSDPAKTLDGTFKDGKENTSKTMWFTDGLVNPEDLAQNPLRFTPDYKAAKSQGLPPFLMPFCGGRQKFCPSTKSSKFPVAQNWKI